MFKYTTYLPFDWFIHDNAVIIDGASEILGSSLVLGDIISANITKKGIRIVSNSRPFLEKVHILVANNHNKFLRSIK